MSKPRPSEFDLCISALHSLRLAGDYYASSSEYARVASEVVQMLGGAREGEEGTPTLKREIARAIARSIGGEQPKGD